MSNISWKTKYLDMRAKLLESTDVAYRLGYEEGLKDAQQQQMQQEQEMQQQMQMQQAQGGGEEGQPPVDENGQPIPEEEQGGMPQDEGGEESPAPEELGEEDASELDQHIDQLEDMVAKGEKPSVTTMRKAVQELASVRKSQKNKWKEKTEKNTSQQKQFVDNIIKKWEKEQKDVTEGLEDTLKDTGLNIEE